MKRSAPQQAPELHVQVLGELSPDGRVRAGQSTPGMGAGGPATGAQADMNGRGYPLGRPPSKSPSHGAPRTALRPR